MTLKHLTLLASAFAALQAGSTAALAQERGHRDGGWDHGARPDARHYSGSRGWVGPRYYSPYSIYASPYYVAPYYYSVPLYGPPPVYVERYYVEDVPPPPRHRLYGERTYSERSYAQAAPPEPARAPAPRMERVTLSAQELFEFDRAQLRSPQPKLDEIAALMIRNPEVSDVRITGYTDRIGTDSYNLKLSQRRADAVKRYLAGKGVAANRLIAVGKGEANPVVQCNDRKMADLIKCLEPNRRVEVEQITIERRSTSSSQ